MSVIAEALIRKAESRDLVAIKSLEIEYSLSPWSIEDYRLEVERDNSMFIVAVVDTKIVGFALARPIMSSVEIYNIAVSRSVRRQGIGRKFLNYLMMNTDSSNLEDVILEVRASNTDAIKFYESFGFEINGRRKDFYRHPVEDALLLKLKAGAESFNA